MNELVIGFFVHGVWSVLALCISTCMKEIIFILG